MGMEPEEPLPTRPVVMVGDEAQATALVLGGWELVLELVVWVSRGMGSLTGSHPGCSQGSRIALVGPGFYPFSPCRKAWQHWMRTW